MTRVEASGSQGDERQRRIEEIESTGQSQVVREMREALGDARCAPPPSPRE